MDKIITDNWTVQTLRIKESDKANLAKILNYYKLTKREFIRASLELWLEKIARGERYIPNNRFPNLEQINRILIRGR